jgi:hypothetical protein
MPIWDQFDDFDLNVHGIPNPHRSTEVQRLRDVNGSRSWKAGAQDGRDQASRIQAMRDPGLEGGLRSKVLRQVNGVAIPCELGEANDIGRGHRFRERLAHADRQSSKCKIRSSSMAALSPLTRDAG